LDIRKKLCTVKIGEALEEAGQRCGGCLFGNIQGQAAPGSEHPDQAADVPFHFRGIG